MYLCLILVPAPLRGWWALREIKAGFIAEYFASKKLSNYTGVFFSVRKTQQLYRSFFLGKKNSAIIPEFSWRRSSAIDFASLKIPKSIKIASWRRLGASWSFVKNSHLGGSWSFMKNTQIHQNRILEASWGVLRVSWGVSWSVSEVSWSALRRLGASSIRLGVCWARLVGSWKRLGASCGVLKPSWEVFGAVLGWLARSGGPRSANS